ncbi:hypothetical protein KA107_00260 [Candidatus Pacearchaeota archaeon]|nr:hypothetical protein [Candidatus Pacearchaeota archaeon]
MDPSKLYKNGEEMCNFLKNRFPVIQGLSISGSISFNLEDDYSDIDIDIWLGEEDYESWRTECPLMELFKKEDIKKEQASNYSFVRDGFKYDFTLISIKGIMKEDWSIEQRFKRSKSYILQDPSGIVLRILQLKTAFSWDVFDSKDRDVKMSIDFYSFYIGAYLNYFTPIAIKRKQYEQANFDIDFAINLFLEYLFIRNKSFYPHNKSKWVLGEKFLSVEDRKLLSECKLIKEHSLKEIKRRRDIIKDLCSNQNLTLINFTHHKGSLNLPEE